jgi:hypothetical protein
MLGEGVSILAFRNELHACRMVPLAPAPIDPFRKTRDPFHRIHRRQSCAYLPSTVEAPLIGPATSLSAVARPVRIGAEDSPGACRSCTLYEWPIFMLLLLFGAGVGVMAVPAGHPSTVRSLLFSSCLVHLLSISCVRSSAGPVVRLRILLHIAWCCHSLGPSLCDHDAQGLQAFAFTPILLHFHFHNSNTTMVHMAAIHWQLRFILAKRVAL